MNPTMRLVYLFISLALCVLNGYSMNSYYVSVRKPFRLFAIVTLVCFVCNAYLFSVVGRAAFMQIVILSIGMPYFVLILLISRKKISQIVFNVWLWITIYSLVNIMSMFLNDITFRNLHFENNVRIIILIGYLIVYNKYLKPYHCSILEIANVNWWLFSLVPALFEMLIVAAVHYSRVPQGFSRNYVVLLVIFVLMILVYAIVVYTFQKAHTAMKLEIAKAVFAQQLDEAKAQVAFLQEAQTQTAIYRHDMRHHLNTIDAFLTTGEVHQARDYIREVQGGIEALTLRHYCENNMVNLLCCSFRDKAARMGIRLEMDVVFPQELRISDMELCSLLSNGLENAVQAVEKLEPECRQIQFHCRIQQDKLLIEIKNPVHAGGGQLLFHDGLPVSNRENHGYGCQSIRSIVRQHQGICVFDEKDGMFLLRVVLPVT